MAVVLDTETTGLVMNATVRDVMLPEVIELCALLVDFDAEPPEVVETIDLLIKPTRPIDEESKSGERHHITNDMVRDAPRFATVLPRLRELIARGDVVIAHNASFDMEVIDFEVRRAGAPPMKWPRAICTVEQTMTVKGHRITLSELHEHLFGMAFEGSHRASTDVRALVRCFGEMLKREMI